LRKLSVIREREREREEKKGKDFGDMHAPSIISILQTDSIHILSAFGGGLFGFWKVEGRRGEGKLI
jgi:hypothetical protein